MAEENSDKKVARKRKLKTSEGAAVEKIISTLLPLPQDAQERVMRCAKAYFEAPGVHDAKN